LFGTIQLVHLFTRQVMTVLMTGFLNLWAMDR